MLTWGLAHHTMPSHPPLPPWLTLRGIRALPTTPPRQEVRAWAGAGIKGGSKRQEERALGHIPCCSAELERQAELSQHCHRARGGEGSYSCSSFPAPFLGRIRTSLGNKEGSTRSLQSPALQKPGGLLP